MKEYYYEYMLISNLRDMSYDTQYGHIGCKDEIALKKYIRKQYRKQFDEEFLKEGNNTRYMKVLEKILEEYADITARDIVMICDEMIDEIIGGVLYDDECK